jgi:hypothetical protein
VSMPHHAGMCTAAQCCMTVHEPRGRAPSLGDPLTPCCSQAKCLSVLQALCGHHGHEMAQAGWAMAGAPAAAEVTRRRTARHAHACVVHLSCTPIHPSTPTTCPAVASWCSGLRHRHVNHRVQHRRHAHVHVHGHGKFNRHVTDRSCWTGRDVT